jgi:hypothetical protein
MKRFRLYLLCCMVVGLVSYCLADTSMTLTELDNYKAAVTDSCCDTNGSWNDCDGDGSSSCPTTTSPSGFGVACATSTHEYAPEGSANDADCESQNGSTCCYVDPVFCTYYKECDCETTFYLYYGAAIYDCEEKNWTTTDEPNNSRVMCSGTDCTPW